MMSNSFIIPDFIQIKRPKSLVTAQVYKIEKVFFTSGINNVYVLYTHMKKIEIFVK